VKFTYNVLLPCAGLQQCL